MVPDVHPVGISESGRSALTEAHYPFLGGPLLPQERFDEFLSDHTADRQLQLGGRSGAGRRCSRGFQHAVEVLNRAEEIPVRRTAATVDPLPDDKVACRLKHLLDSPANPCIECRGA